MSDLKVALAISTATNVMLFWLMWSTCKTYKNIAKLWEREAKEWRRVSLQLSARLGIYPRMADPPPSEPSDTRAR